MWGKAPEKEWWSLTRHECKTPFYYRGVFYFYKKIISDIDFKSLPLEYRINFMEIPTSGPHALETREVSLDWDYFEKVDYETNNI